MDSVANTEGMRARLLELLRERAYREGEFVLSSGQTSNYYINGKQIVLHPESAWLIGEVLLQHLDDLGIEYDAVGGLAIGAVPITTSLVTACYRHGKDVEGFFVRNERKQHGTRDMVEGRLPESARVVILDDVVTSGRSALHAVNAVHDAGATVECVVAIVDREQGARESFTSEGLRYEPIFVKSELATHAAAH